MTSATPPPHTYPLISSFRPLTHQSHLIGLTLHLQLCLITCCFLPPSVRRSPPSSSCCSSSSVSLPWRAVVPSLELFIIFFKQREKKKPINTGKRLHHWKWQSHFLLFPPLFNTKQELLAFLIMQPAVAGREGGGTARLFSFQPDDFTYDNKLRRSRIDQWEHLLQSDWNQKLQTPPPLSKEAPPPASFSRSDVENQKKKHN